MSTRTMVGTLMVLCGCYEAPADLVDTQTPPGQVQKNDPPASPAPPETPRVVCDMAKFSFTQESGCVNDGWVEFCAAKGGAPLLNTLRAISPDVSIVEGRIGRAGCNEATEYLVTHTVSEVDCMQRYGALTDPAWNTLCALSQVPETKHFVPGFAE
ncbi:MAG: hypothetical protein JNK82_29500 [Myxococcaceae bacterium]|nr:hypothetical protein [Myxococcaceae bacterium]